MADNFRGMEPTESNRTDWSPAGNGGLAPAEGSIASGGDTTQESESPASATHEYKDKLMEAAAQAKDYLSEKASAVGGKIKEFATDDLSGMANKAKDFARQNPGQAILISAGAGLLLGLIVRGRR